MKKSRVSQTIPRRMARAKKRGLTYGQYMRQVHFKRKQKRARPPPRQKRPIYYGKHGRTQRPTHIYGVNLQTRAGMPHSLFVKGSSMVGAPRPKQLLRFQPTRKMLAHGFKPVSLRFFGEKKARALELQTRRDWINEMVQDLKSKGLL